MQLTLRDDLLLAPVDINGILGMGFLLQTGALINLRTLELDFQPE
jgi:hypothetical protein